MQNGYYAAKKSRKSPPLGLVLVGAVVLAAVVLIQGSVHNANSEDVSGYVLLTVRVNGKPTAERIPFRSLAGRTVEDYSTTVHDAMAIQGVPVSVTAEWVGN